MFATRAGALHLDLDLYHAVFAGFVGGLFGSATSGTYSVYVLGFDTCSANASYQLRITDRGRVVYDSGGSVAPGEQSTPVQISH